jgi:hypothetical protein
MNQTSRRWIRGAMAAAGVGAASGALAARSASRRWQEATHRSIAALEGAARTPTGRVSFDDLASLPAPVQRYFRLVLRDGQPLIRSARVEQSGTFRSRETGDPGAGWAEFGATQHFTADPPGFVWDARIRMLPLLSVWVRDGYVTEHASMHGAVAALLTVVDAADDRSLRAGALQRWLAEAAWLPTALLPGRGISWEPMDERHARAVVVDGANAVSLEFGFGPGGEMSSVYTPARPREAPGRKGEYITAPWGARYRGYREYHGMRAPTEAEAYWVLQGREQPYYRGRNVSVEHDFGEQAAST